MALVKRPPLSPASGNGLFRNDHFQIAYATSDIERACQLFGERYGIQQWRRLEGPLKEGGKVRLELAWAGGVMYGLVQAEGPGSEIYNNVLPQEGFSIRLHHLGYFVEDEQSWLALQTEVEASGWNVVLRTDAPGFMQGFIIEVPELGHYLEFVFPEPAAIAFFEGVPSS